MAGALTYEEFMYYSKEHYEKGGDSYFECWDKKMFDEYVGLFGPVTKKKALAMYRENLDIERDRAGYWM